MNQSSYKAKIESINEIQNFVKKRISHINNDESKLYMIDLLIEEIVVNIINYGFKEAEEGFINVMVDTANEDLVVEISDNGIPFSPLDQKAPDLSISIENRHPGGLGIFLVKQIAKDIEYVRKNNNNILRLYLDL